MSVFQGLDTKALKSLLLSFSSTKVQPSLVSHMSPEGSPECPLLYLTSLPAFASVETSVPYTIFSGKTF